MKYFIKLRWWRDCHFRVDHHQNLVIAENPATYLERQRARLGGEFTSIVMDFACPVGDDVEVSSDPYLGYRRPPLTPAQQRRNDRIAVGLFATLMIIAVGLLLI